MEQSTADKRKPTNRELYRSLSRYNHGKDPSDEKDGFSRKPYKKLPESQRITMELEDVEIVNEEISESAESSGPDYKGLLKAIISNISKN